MSTLLPSIISTSPPPCGRVITLPLFTLLLSPFPEPWLVSSHHSSVSSNVTFSRKLFLCTTQSLFPSALSIMPPCFIFFIAFSTVKKNFARVFVYFLISSVSGQGRALLFLPQSLAYCRLLITACWMNEWTVPALLRGNQMYLGN